MARWSHGTNHVKDTENIMLKKVHMKLHELQNYKHWEKVLIIHILLEAPIVVSLILLSLPLAAQDDTLHYKQRQLSIQKLRY